MVDTIRAGDLVHLRSGGPTMTVHYVHLDTTKVKHPVSAMCTWFDERQAQRKDFNVAELLTGPAPESEPSTGDGG